MSRVRPKRNPSPGRVPEPERLTVRWFLIALLGGAAYVAGDHREGAMGGIVALVAVVGVLHTILD